MPFNITKHADNFPTVFATKYIITYVTNYCFMSTFLGMKYSFENEKSIFALSFIGLLQTFTLSHVGLHTHLIFIENVMEF